MERNPGMSKTSHKLWFIQGILCDIESLDHVTSGQEDYPVISDMCRRLCLATVWRGYLLFMKGLWLGLVRKK